MAPAPAVTELECLRCHAVYDDQRLFTGCPRCAAQSINVNLTVRIPAAARGSLTPESFPAAPRSLWRFRRLLPLPDAEPISLGEGATPLVPLARLGRRLGLPHLYTYGKLAFFDCGGTRLMLEDRSILEVVGLHNDSVLYFRVADVHAAHDELQRRGVQFTDAPHMIAKHPDGTEEWMAFFRDSEGGMLAIMAQVKPA